jgi:hypothetical protein
MTSMINFPEVEKPLWKKIIAQNINDIVTIVTISAAKWTDVLLHSCLVSCDFMFIGNIYSSIKLFSAGGWRWRWQ